MSKNTAALKALGIKTGVTYSVVCVGCIQKDCVYYNDCQDNAIGLTAKEKGGYMICHDYKTDLFKRCEDKRVYWKRCDTTPTIASGGVPK